LAHDGELQPVVIGDLDHIAEEEKAFFRKGEEAYFFSRKVRVWRCWVLKKADDSR
jgi:thiamine pyrophosphokinase